MMKRLLLGTATALVIASPAWADTFTYGSFTINPADDPVTLTDPTLGGGIDKTVLAGEITLQGAGPNLGQSVMLWCLDIINNLVQNPSPPYTYQISPLALDGSQAGVPTLTATQATEIGDLMAGLDNGNLSDLAATQIAIWQIEYGNGLTITGGATDMAAATADEAYAATHLQAIQVLAYHDAVTAPDQTLGRAVVPVAEPASFALFGASLLGLGLLRRRQRGRQT